MPKVAAALVALICWAGLAIQFSVSYANQHDVVATLWVLARFFTILTNMAVAVVMTSVAIDRPVSPLVLRGLTFVILLMGIVYSTLLHVLYSLTGPAVISNLLLHKISPVAMTLWWLLFAPKARLKRSAPLWWAAYPLAYFVYALVRGHHDGRYPYPFMDVAKIGWLQTALNSGGIALAFILTGFVLVWIDSWRPLGSKRARS